MRSAAMVMPCLSRRHAKRRERYALWTPTATFTPWKSIRSSTIDAAFLFGNVLLEFGNSLRPTIFLPWCGNNSQRSATFRTVPQVLQTTAPSCVLRHPSV